jgi:DNA polymerase-3 subunit chi
MTEIDFHYNVAHKVQHACRLLRKATVAHGARVLVVGEPSTLDALDAALWSFSETDFVAHCHRDAHPAVVARSAVVLATEVGAEPTQLPVLVNVGETVPEGFERFGRVFELVGSDESSRIGGRLRWRQYAACGYTPRRSDVGTGSA